MSVEELKSAHDFPELPLTVITGAMPGPAILMVPSIFEIHLKNQQKLSVFPWDTK